MEGKNTIYKIKHQLVAIGKKTDEETREELKRIRKDLNIALDDLHILEIIKKHLYIYAVSEDSYEYIKWNKNVKEDIQDYIKLKEFIRSKGK